MVRYVLDTDHISLFLGGQINVQARLRQEMANTAIAIVSVQEVFNGWVGRLNRADTEPQQIRAYTKLNGAMQFFQSMEVMNYDETASQIYQRLIQSDRNLAKRRIDKDMRIASIALSQGATIVTRNRRDFELVTDLAIDDWSI
jgi:tRNA(fMet)-specific endonuclease VapC